MELPMELAKRFKSGPNNSIVESVKPSFPEMAVEFLDSKDAVAHPQVKFNRFDNDANFSVRLDDLGGAVSLEGNKIIYDSSYGRSSIYELPDGGFEFDLTLLSKPAFRNGIDDANYFYVTYTLQHKNIVAYKQLLDASPDVYQPENVVDSYAIYHATKVHNFYAPGAAPQLYRTGKLQHIYRPFVVNAEQNKAWCTLNIDLVANKLVVGIPWSFLNATSYPVLLDPTFGNTVAGASWAVKASAGLNAICLVDPSFRHTAGSGETITQLEGYVDSNGGANVNFSLAVYDITANVPVNRLGGVATSTATATPGWRSATVSLNPVNGVTYGPAITLEGNSTHRIAYDATAGELNCSVDITGVMPAVWLEGITVARKYSFFATYITSATDFFAYKPVRSIVSPVARNLSHLKSE